MPPPSLAMGSGHGPNGYVFTCLFVLPTLLFFSLFFFLLDSFATEYNNELGGIGRDQRRQQQKRGAGRGRNGCVFCFFSLV